jgi:subtilisin family serine protease
VRAVTFVPFSTTFIFQGNSMHKLARAITMALGLVGVAASAHAGGRYVVVFKSELLPADAAVRIANSGGKVNRSFQQIGVVTVSGDATFAKRIAKDTKVLSVGSEHFFKRPDTVSIPMSDADIAAAEAAPTAADGLYKAYQWDMRRIGAPTVWARLPVAATQPRVAVLDVGVMDSHPDLVGQVDNSVATGYCSTAGGPNHTAGYPVYASLIDLDAHPDWSLADGCTAVAPSYESHGTHVAGTIAAKFGGGLMVGVAPDAKIGAYKVFDRYRYTDPVDGLVDTVGAFDGPVFNAIILATQAGYPVISMSLGSHVLRNDKGSNASWLAWDRVAKWANRNGALLIASSGNSAYDLNGKLAHVPSDLSTVMSTSATGTNHLQVVSGAVSAASGSDVLASYSNYGSSVDIAAPGGDCGPDPTTCIGQYLIANDGISATGGVTYLLMAGTSMATPHVSAVAAYVRSIHPTWTPGTVRSWLKDHAQAIGSRQYFGAGMVDADAASN